MTDEELKAIGWRICERRRQMNLTQEQIAEKMCVSVQMVSNLERGNKAIRIENLLKISKLLGISTDYILMGKNYNKESDNIAEKYKRLSDVDCKMIDMIVDFCLEK